jgi:hypothetical protein
MGPALLLSRDEMLDHPLPLMARKKPAEAHDFMAAPHELFSYWFEIAALPD